MSISYYAVPVRDAARIGSIVEGTDSSAVIDPQAMHARLAKLWVFQNKTAAQLQWRAGGDYILVTFSPSHVHVSHNAGKGSSQITALMEIITALKSAGLHIYDPQRGSFFD